MKSACLNYWGTALFLWYGYDYKLPDSSDRCTADGRWSIRPQRAEKQMKRSES